nr:MAG TPA: hypothetical protein [Caudoviricetes sp.]
MESPWLSHRSARRQSCSGSSTGSMPPGWISR